MDIYGVPDICLILLKSNKSTIDSSQLVLHFPTFKPFYTKSKRTIIDIKLTQELIYLLL